MVGGQCGPPLAVLRGQVELCTCKPLGTRLHGRAQLMKDPAHLALAPLVRCDVAAPQQQHWPPETSLFLGQTRLPPTPWPSSSF